MIIIAYYINENKTYSVPSIDLSSMGLTADQVGQIALEYWLKETYTAMGEAHHKDALESYNQDYEDFKGDPMVGDVENEIPPIWNYSDNFTLWACTRVSESHEVWCAIAGPDRGEEVVLTIME